jgi:hypothetical protein
MTKWQVLVNTVTNSRYPYLATGNFLTSSELTASQEGLCSMELQQGLSWLATGLKSFQASSAVHLRSQFFRHVSTLDDEAITLSRKVEHKFPSDPTPHRWTADSSCRIESWEVRRDVHWQRQRSLQPLLPFRMACNGCGWEKWTRLTLWG